MEISIILFHRLQIQYQPSKNQISSSINGFPLIPARCIIYRLTSLYLISWLIINNRSVQLRTLRRWMDTVVDGIPNAKRVVSIILCRWVEDDIKAYDRLLHKWFPIKPPKVSQRQLSFRNVSQIEINFLDDVKNSNRPYHFNPIFIQQD